VNQKSRDFYQIFVISNKKSEATVWISEIWKIYSLAYGFLIFVISVLGGGERDARECRAALSA
jgi:hypothetical protein